MKDQLLRPAAYLWIILIVALMLSAAMGRQPIIPANAVFVPPQTAAVTPGRLGAYIPITSAETDPKKGALSTLGFNNDFAKAGGWRGQAPSIAGLLKAGGDEVALLWRPHGQRPSGTMPFDAMLYLDPKSANPIERAAADEREFVRFLKVVKNQLDENAGGHDLGELWVYLGDPNQGEEEEGKKGKAPLTALGTEERNKRILRVLHPLKVAGVDGVVIDASGPQTKGSEYEEIAQFILSQGFEFAGYEGWAEKGTIGSPEAWATDQRYTGFLMAYWAHEAPAFYVDPKVVQGDLVMLNAGKPGQRGWATTAPEAIQFIDKQNAAGITVLVDIWTRPTTPKKKGR